MSTARALACIALLLCCVNLTRIAVGHLPARSRPAVADCSPIEVWRGQQRAVIACAGLCGSRPGDRVETVLEGREGALGEGCKVERGGMRPAWRLALGLPIDLNAASVADLRRLPGVGAKTAAAIVAYRGAHGAFGAVDELRRVRGIARKSLDKLAPYLMVSSR